MDIKKTDFHGVEVLWKKAVSFNPDGDPEHFYTGFDPHTELLPKGYRKRPDRLELPCDIIFMQDQAVVLRDGVTIYTDVLRPNDDEKHPAIISWSPYGKNGSGHEHATDIPGVDMEQLSDLQKFEACDPAFWCNEGYAVINPDARGAYMSEGDIQIWGTQDGKDAYDVVEWVARQPWSNGKVAFSGNSWLAAAQWFAAAEQPPHLAAIAPWEGVTDLLGDDVCRGGVVDTAFNAQTVYNAPGRGYVQDTPAMAKLYPFRNAFWQDKRPAFERITVPAYIVASYNSPAHTRGTFEGFRRIASEDKWLRVHNSNEWEDYYQPENIADLKRFFDYFLKGEENGWRDTPRVRLSVIDPGGEDIVNRPEADYPLERQVFRKFYLNGDGRLTEEPSGQSAVCSYIGNKPGEKLAFRYTFDRDAELSGYGKLRIYVEAENADDMDIYINVNKLSADGTLLRQRGVSFYSGPTGVLRVSRRKLDENLSTESEPFLALDEDIQKLKPGQIVCVDIGLWPTGMIFHKGEQLQLLIQPKKPLPDLVIALDQAIQRIQAKKNGGKPEQRRGPAGHIGEVMQGGPGGSPPQEEGSPAVHKFHVGGKYESYLCIPFV